MAEYIGNVCKIWIKERKLEKYKVIYENANYFMCANGNSIPFSMKKHSIGDGILCVSEVWTDYKDFLEYKECFGYDYDYVFVFIPRKHKKLFSQLLTEFSEITAKDVRLKQLKKGIESTEMLIDNITRRKANYESSLADYKIKLQEYKKEYNKLMEETK